MSIADLEYRAGAFCLYHGHLWQATNQQGKYQCSNCKTVAYCPTCLLTLPRHALTMRCEKHQERIAHA